MTQGDANDAAQIGVRLTLTRKLQRVQWPGRGKAVLCPLHRQWPVDFKVTRPGVVLWGSGSEFARSQALMQLAGSAHHPSIPYRPQSNGHVERVNKEVIRFLRYLVNNRRVEDDWESVLPISQRIISSCKSASIGLSPAELLIPAGISTTACSPAG
jgi:hypothetical protein